MTAAEQRANLGLAHHHFVCIADPWHLTTLWEIPEFKTAFQEGRVQQGSVPGDLHTGPVFPVWYSADVNGALLQEWGFDPPLMVQ